LIFVSDMNALSAILLALVAVPSSAAPSALTMNSDATARFVAVHGRNAWAGGYANRGLEVWTGALEIASEVRPEFFRKGDVTSVPGSKILATISVAPDHFSRVYAGADFTVEEDAWIPLHQPALLLRYTVRSDVPVEVIVRFRPSLNLMWPAAIGGQSLHWDATQSGYILTEPTKEFAAIVLAPGATAHDEPLNDARLEPQNDAIAVTLSPQSPQILFAQSKAGAANSGPGLDFVGLRGLLSSSEWREELSQHYNHLLASELQIETPDADVNRALAWAEIDLDQAWFCNEKLGCGYVAGYGPSRRSRRPQYAWYFAGDGMVALRAALAAGDLERARDELRFIAKYQDRKTGMIWHELSQSAPYIDWQNKYPYMFVHADLTYPYISAVAAYVRRSNDRQFLREIWPSVERAFEYGRSLITKNELPAIPKEKEGADEQNPRREELALSANWIAASDDYAFLSDLMGDRESAKAARKFGGSARAAFNQRYWNASDNFPIGGYRRDGSAIAEHGVSGLDAVADHLFTDKHIQHLLDEIASWPFQSDWGTRGVAVGEPGYNPTGYAHGSVSGLRTAEAAEAFWTEHRPRTGFEIWRELVPWFSLDSLGHMHEVLRGDVYYPQSESVPEQAWSSAGFLSAAVQGLFGLQADAASGVLTLAPHLPANWDNVILRNVRLGSSDLTFIFRQSVDSLKVHIEDAGAPLHLSYNPAIPPGSRNITATVNGRKLAPHVEAHAEDQHVVLPLEVQLGATDIGVHYDDGVGVIMPELNPAISEASSAMKLISVAFEKSVLRLGVDVMTGSDNTMKLRTRRGIKSATNASLAKLSGEIYQLTIAPVRDRKSDGYRREQVEVVFSK
jgi:hypothetical protein